MTAFQLGLDQMPDATPANLTKFYVPGMDCSMGVGFWITDFVFCCYHLYCTEAGIFGRHTVVQSFPRFVVWVLVCCSLFLFAQKVADY